MEVIVVGCGVFGLSTCLELASKGYNVTALDAFSVPSPWSAASDINKIIRIEYPDKHSATLAYEALESWKHSPLYSPFFQESGRLTLTPEGTSRSEYERKSIEILSELGVNQKFEHLHTPTEVSERIPEFSENTLNEKFNAVFNSRCGWANSEKVLVAVYQEAVKKGVKFIFGEDGHVTQIESKKVTVKSGKTYTGSKIVVCAGASLVFLTKLDHQIKPWAAFVTHIQLSPQEYEKYKNMPIFFSAEYGYFFPPERSTRRIKISLTTCDAYALGKDPFDSEKIWVPTYDSTHKLPLDHVKDARVLLLLVVPELAKHDFVDSKTCWIADSGDNKFLIDESPYYKDVYVTSGDSGHGFKFFPNIGKYIVQKMEGNLSSDLSKMWSWKQNPDFSVKISSRQPRPHLNLENTVFDNNS